MERASDAVLNGSDDRLFGRRLSDLITGRDPSGGNVVLTIDPAVQKVAYDQLTRKRYAGAVVALQPATGAILAMASTPSFDPNPLANHNTGTQKQAWTDFTTAKPPVLINRAIQATYPPGSTFKLVDMAAALSSGKFTEDSPVTAAPRITLQGTRNTAFADLDAQLGVQAVRAQADAFKIGQADLEIPLAVAPSTIGSIPDVAALQQSAIGQRDVALTPLQNAMIVAAIANGGQVMAPYLMKEIQGQDLQPVETTQPDRLGRAVSTDVAQRLNALMVNNEDSYAGNGKITGVQIAAKTGTAEHGDDPKNLAPHVWYVAFAPAEAPQVAVAVLVEDGGDPNNLAATGGLVAAPIGRAVIAAALGKASR